MAPLSVFSRNLITNEKTANLESQVHGLRESLNDLGSMLDLIIAKGHLSSCPDLEDKAYNLLDLVELQLKQTG